MKMTGFIRSAVVALPVLAAGFMTTDANAEIVINQIDDPNVPDGYVANELTWVSADTDWTSAVLVINATGSAYQETPPNHGPYRLWMIDPYPSLEFDTYVGIVETDPVYDPVGNGIPGGASDLGGGPLSLDLPQISVSWYDTKFEDFGEPIRIGMMTLSEDAMGDWRLSSAGVTYSGDVVNGAMVPEPASLGLLGLGGLALLRRR